MIKNGLRSKICKRCQNLYKTPYKYSKICVDCYKVESHTPPLFKGHNPTHFTRVESV